MRRRSLDNASTRARRCRVSNEPLRRVLFLREEKLEKSGRVAPFNPTGELGQGCVARSTEKGLAGDILVSHIGINAAQVEMLGGVFGQLAQGLRGKSASLAFAEHDDAHLGPQMVGAEGTEVDDAHALAFGFNDQSQLTVEINVGMLVGKVLVHGVARKGLTRGTPLPQGGIVFDAVHQVKVLGFKSSQRYLGFGGHAGRK